MRVSPGILQAYNVSHRACSHTNYMSEMLEVGLYIYDAACKKNVIKKIKIIRLNTDSKLFD